MQRQPPALPWRPAPQSRRRRQTEIRELMALARQRRLRRGRPRTPTRRFSACTTPPRWRCAISGCRGTTACGWRTGSGMMPETAVIMATRRQDVGRRHEPAPGVIDYLTKPFMHDRLRNRWCADRVAQGGRDSRRWRRNLRGSGEPAPAPERRARPANRLRHGARRPHCRYPVRSRRVRTPTASPRCRRVGVALQLREDDMVSLERAALLHDVGKLAMPKRSSGSPRRSRSRNRT